MLGSSVPQSVPFVLRLVWPWYVLLITKSARSSLGYMHILVFVTEFVNGCKSEIIVSCYYYCYEGENHSCHTFPPFYLLINIALITK